jgi:hypothetical protein
LNSAIDAADPPFGFGLVDRTDLVCFSFTFAGFAIGFFFDFSMFATSFG